MTSTRKDPVLVVLQLSGGNDALNTIIPYSNPLYLDNRPNVRIEDQQGHSHQRPDRIQPGDGADESACTMRARSPSSRAWDTPARAAPTSARWTSGTPASRTRWVTEGWLGRTVRDLDPGKENVLTGVNFGRGLPRSLVAPGVPVASVGNLETYGVLTGIEIEDQRTKALDVFSRVYSPMLGTGPVMDYLAQTGLDALEGADILSTAPGMYSSTVEYGKDDVAQYMRNIVQVHLAGLGTRVLYTTAPYNSFDTHAGELANHTRLWTETSQAVADFYDDLNEHDAGDNVVLLVFTEFGRRVHDNGSGTDHGSGGVAFVVGESVKGGLYGEYPSLEADKLLEGDLQFNNDFRGLYSALLEKWMGLDAKPIVNGSFEQMDFISQAL